MTRTSVVALLLVFVAVAIHAQEIRIPYQISVGVGYLVQYGDWIGVQDEDGDGTDAVWTQGNGNTRIALDGTVNMGARRRFGLGLAYRRLAPDNGYAINGIGPAIAWTDPHSAKRVYRALQSDGSPRTAGPVSFQLDCIVPKSCDPAIIRSPAKASSFSDLRRSRKCIRSSTV